ncbi:MAG: ATP-binding protein [Chlamydiota bacterium]
MTYPYIPRLISDRVKKLFNAFPSLVLTGARQVGKSTLLKKLFPDIPCVVFDPVHDVQNARQDPELFLKNHRPPIILDEIQYAPALVPVIKRLIDENRIPGQYILTGSQQWGVLNTVAESLAGRTAIVNLEGFSFSEMAKKQPEKLWLERWLLDPESFLTKKQQRLDLPYTLYELLWRGSLPEAFFLDRDVISDYHYSYQKTYIEKDIRLLADLSDLQLFGRFVKLAAALVAQEINYSEIGRDLDVSPQTARRWLALLSHIFEWFEVPAFSNNPVKKVSLKPKGYSADCGQICFSQMISSKDAIASHPLMGAIFENAIVSEIRKQCLIMSSPPQMYHWREHQGAEIDLLLERDGKFFPIEIKASTKPSKSDVKGIKTFREKHSHLNVQKGLVIAPVDNVYGLSAEDMVIPFDIF